VKPFGQKHYINAIHLPIYHLVVAVAVMRLSGEVSKTGIHRAATGYSQVAFFHNFNKLLLP